MDHDSFESKKMTVFLLFLVIFFVGCGGDSSDQQTDGKTKAAQKEEADKLPEGLTPEQAAKVVAKVGERTITVGDVTRQINRLSPYIRRRWAAPEKRKEFLEKLIRVELLSQEAERLGLSDDPEVQRTVKQVMIRLMVKNDLEKELFPSTIDEKLLKEQYEKDNDKYHRPAQVRASHIMVKTRPEAEKLLADLKEHKNDTRYFRQKAREFSVDEKSKDRGGDLGYFSKPAERREDEPEIAPPVAEAVWKLKNVADLVDGLVQTEQGFHVVKLTNKRPEMNRSFESVKRMIENRLLREKRKEMMESFIDGLRKKAKVEVNKENLAKMKVKKNLPHGEYGRTSRGPIPKMGQGRKPAVKENGTKFKGRLAKKNRKGEQE